MEMDHLVAALEILLPQSLPPRPRSRSMVILNSLALHLHPVRVPKRATRVTYTWGLGGLATWIFVILTFTGVFLMWYYIPTTAGRVLDHRQAGDRCHFWLVFAQHAPVGGPRHGAGRLCT